MSLVLWCSGLLPAALTTNNANFTNVALVVAYNDFAARDCLFWGLSLWRGWKPLAHFAW